MAGAGAKLFTSGSVLTADQVNTYLMDQAIMKFASTTARDAAFGGAGEPTLAEGMFAYTTDTNTLWLYNGSSWVAVLGSDIGEQALSNRNVIINGAMQVAQRGTSTASLSSATGYFSADRFFAAFSNQGTWTQSVEADAPTGSGFRNSLKMLCTTADAAPAAGDFVFLSQKLEGQNVQQFLKGTSAAKGWAVSFWVKSNVTGTYTLTLQDTDNSRIVSANYSVSASGTWEKKTVSFPADTTGVLNNDNGTSIELYWGLGSGTDRTSGTLRTSWASQVTADFFVGQTNVAATLNNYWQVTGIQLEAGAVATPFEFEEYGATLLKCQRYFIRIQGVATISHHVGDGATNIRGGMCPIPTTMRGTPTLTERGALVLLNSALTDRGVASFNNINQRQGSIGFGIASVSNSTAGEFLWCAADTSADGIDISAEL
jgi:hypothetical protein